MDIKEIIEDRKRENQRLGWYKKGTAEILDNGPESKLFKEKLEYFMIQRGLSKFDCYNGIVSKVMFNNFLYLFIAVPILAIVPLFIAILIRYQIEDCRYYAHLWNRSAYPPVRPSPPITVVLKER